MLKEDIRKMWNLQEQNTLKINLYRCTECSESQIVHVEYVNFSISIFWNDYIESYCCSPEEIGIVWNRYWCIVLDSLEMWEEYRSTLELPASQKSSTMFSNYTDIFNSDSDFLIPSCFFFFFLYLIFTAQFPYIIVLFITTIYIQWNIYGFSINIRSYSQIFLLYLIINNK